MLDMPDIVDCHHHLWDLDKHYHVWLHAQPRVETFIGDYEPICTNYLPTNLISDAGDLPLVKSVHVQAEFDPTNPVGETAWLQEQSDTYGFPHGIVGYADLSSPTFESMLEGHLQYRNFRGIRQLLNWDVIPDRAFAEHGDYLTSTEWRKGFALLARRGLSFDMQIWPHQMAEAASLAGDIPETPIAINHTGFPMDRDEESMHVWRDGMRQLARHAQVYVKISGLGMLDHDWTEESIRPLVLETIEIFGPDRCMFGSNFPVDKLFSDYESIFNAFSSITRDFPEDERRMLFNGTATNFYRLG